MSQEVVGRRQPVEVCWLRPGRHTGRVGGPGPLSPEAHGCVEETEQNQGSAVEGGGAATYAEGRGDRTGGCLLWARHAAPVMTVFILQRVRGVSSLQVGKLRHRAVQETPAPGPTASEWQEQSSSPGLFFVLGDQLRVWKQGAVLQLLLNGRKIST